MFSSVLLLVPVLLAAPAVPPASPTRVELVFGGDVIPHGEVKQAAAEHAREAPRDGGAAGSLNHQGWDHLFGPISEVLRTADVGVVNLETPVTDNKRAVTRELLFNAPSSMVHGLAAAGVRVVSTGNNHALDQHREGIVETLRHLDAAGIRHTGTGASAAAAWAPVYLERRGVRLGFFSFTRWLNGFRNLADASQPHVAYVPYPEHKRLGGVSVEEVVERVRAAAGPCDALVVMVHWGTEYSQAPHPDDQKLARAMLEAGAAVVIGHHPHVLQPLETYRTASGRQGLIAYSLGNLLANQDRHYTFAHEREAARRGNKRDSMLLRVSLVRPSPGAKVELGAVSVLPVWIENNAVTRRRQEPRHIQPVLIDRELEAISERLALLEARSEKLTVSASALGVEREKTAQRLEAVRRARAEARGARPTREERQAGAERVKGALRAWVEQVRAERRARAEQARQERELKTERTTLTRRLEMARHRRERILRMVPAGLAVALAGWKPSTGSGSLTAQSAP